MKTINTVLPVYNALNKQCYERAKRKNSNVVDINATPTPRFKLPQMQWNVESDNPGLITSVRLIDRDGNYAINTHAFAEWKAPVWYNYLASWGTFTLGTTPQTMNDINSAIGAAGGGHDGSTQWMYCMAGETITIKGTLTLNSGVTPQFVLYDIAGTPIDSEIIASGYGSYTFTITTNNYYRIFIRNQGVNATNFSFKGVTFERSEFINHFCSGINSIYDFTNDGYDSFAQPGSGTPNISAAVKTTAAGEARLQGVMESGGYFVSATTQRFKVDCYLTLTSGTAPKIELRDAATGLSTKSNTVTLSAGRNVFILTPTSVANVIPVIFNADTEVSNFAVDFAMGIVDTFEPMLYTALTDDYFQYKGNTLLWLLPESEYYLKMETLNGYVYYSEYFKATCVYENLILSLSNSDYDTFITQGTSIISAINSSGSAVCFSPVNTISVRKGEIITLIVNTTINSGESPECVFRSNYVMGSTWGTLISNTVTLINGLNILTFTITKDSEYSHILIINTAASNFSTSEILVIRSYSEKYLTFNFENSCDLGDILYQDNFEQTLYIESETMEPFFELDDEGQKNGDGRFVRTFGRQVKKYTVRTLAVPAYIVELFNRMKLHDDVELIDLVGDTNDVYNLEVDHEWLFEDKYYAKVDLTFDFDEAFVVSSCCVNFT